MDKLNGVIDMLGKAITDLESLQSKGKTKEEVALHVNKFIHEQCVDGVPHDIGWNVVEMVEEYAQSHANKDGWVSVEELKSIGYKKCLGCGEIVRMQYACPECNPMG